MYADIQCELMHLLLRSLAFHWDKRELRLKVLTHREDFSRKGAKAQSAAAFLEVFFAPLRKRSSGLSVLRTKPHKRAKLRHAAQRRVPDDTRPQGYHPSTRGLEQRR